MTDDRPTKPQHLAMIWDRYLGTAMRRPRQALRRLFGAGDALADLYYGVMKGAFSREHRAVLYGIDRYEQSGKHGNANSVLLRRNTHRLEKGLLMRPRRKVFALNYIEETVNAYERSVAVYERDGGDGEELRWTHDVLAKYFEVTSSDPLLDRMQARFEALPPMEAPAGACASRPYLRDLVGPPPVEHDAFHRLARRRRSVRWFLQKPVPRELIDKALLSAIEAPSACNRQPFRFHIFDEPEQVAMVAGLASGAKGYAHNIPAIAVLVGQLRAYFHPRDRHVIYIDASLAAMGFMLALETLSLSSCPINWPDLADRERKMAEALDLEPDERPIMLMAFGYPDPEGAVAYSRKLSLDTIRSYNR